MFAFFATVARDSEAADRVETLFGDDWAGLNGHTQDALAAHAGGLLGTLEQQQTEDGDIVGISETNDGVETADRVTAYGGLSDVGDGDIATDVQETKDATMEFHAAQAARSEADAFRVIADDGSSSWTAKLWYDADNGEIVFNSDDAGTHRFSENKIFIDYNDGTINGDSVGVTFADGVDDEYDIRFQNTDNALGGFDALVNGTGELSATEGDLENGDAWTRSSALITTAELEVTYESASSIHTDLVEHSVDPTDSRALTASGFAPETWNPDGPSGPDEPGEDPGDGTPEDPRVPENIDDIIGGPGGGGSGDATGNPLGTDVNVYEGPDGNRQVEVSAPGAALDPDGTTTFVQDGTTYELDNAQYNSRQRSLEGDSVSKEYDVGADGILMDGSSDQLMNDALDDGEEVQSLGNDVGSDTTVVESTTGAGDYEYGPDGSITGIGGNDDGGSSDPGGHLIPGDVADSLDGMFGSGGGSDNIDSGGHYTGGF